MAWHTGRMETLLEDKTNTRQGDGKQNRRFPFGAPKDMKDGSYMLRFTEHTEHNPDGWAVVSVHGIQGEMNGKCDYVLAAESYDEPETAGSKCLLHLLDWLKDNEARVKQMSQEFQEACDHLRIWRKYRFVVLTDAVCEMKTNPKSGKEFASFRTPATIEESGKTTGIIWDVEAEGLVRKIMDLGATYPNLTDIRRGRWFRFTKVGSKYELADANKDGPLNEKELELIKAYPMLPKMVAKSKKGKADIVCLLTAAWFWPRLLELGYKPNWKDEVPTSLPDEPKDDVKHFPSDFSEVDLPEDD